MKQAVSKLSRSRRERARQGVRTTSIVATLLLASAVASMVAAAVESAPAGAVPPPTPCGAPSFSGTTATVTCGYTGTLQTWTVPAGITVASFDVKGAQGGAAAAGAAGGRG